MDLDGFQQAAIKTDKEPKIAAMAEVVPFLGLAGETGELPLIEYKKYIRDGSAP